MSEIDRLTAKVNFLLDMIEVITENADYQEMEILDDTKYVSEIRQSLITASNLIWHILRVKDNENE